MELTGKVAIVAGAAWGGIGAATAHRFAQAGAKLVINTRNREEKLLETAERIQAVGGQVATVMGDVKDTSTWEALVKTALDQFGQVDILVHNAAQTFLKRAVEFTQEEWDLGLAVTLGAPG